jgi:UDP-glucose 4-epimerase
MSRRVLVTGAAGFIGSNLVETLVAETDWVIIGIDNYSTGTPANVTHLVRDGRFTMHEGDVAGLDDLREFETIFHLAALPRIQPSFDTPCEHLTANLANSIHILEIMMRQRHFPRLVYSSSSAIYGNPATTPTTEEEPISCLNPYSFQKYEVEKYLELLAQRHPLDYVALRYFNPYGPRSFNPSNPFNAYSSVMGIFLHRYREGLPLLVTGDGSQQRDFVHVRDVARANIRAASAPGPMNRAFNVGYGSTMSIIDLARRISNHIEFIADRPGEARVTHADIHKARAYLGWKPTISVEQYLARELG